MTVAVLCVHAKSIYHTLDGVDIYDAKRDARNFLGGTPVIAHPPCRAWSLFLRHQAKPLAHEKELGLWCCEQVQKWGGVLEQPAHSLLFAAADFPIPSQYQKESDLWTAEVWQAWWGFPTKKRTWLAFSKIQRSKVDFPFLLHDKRNDGSTFGRMSTTQRSLTTRAFAMWLIKIAEMANPAYKS